MQVRRCLSLGVRPRTDEPAGVDLLGMGWRLLGRV